MIHCAHVKNSGGQENNINMIEKYETFRQQSRTLVVATPTVSLLKRQPT